MRHRPLLVWTLAFAGGIGAATMGAAPVWALTVAAAAGLAALAASAKRPLLFLLGLSLTGLAAGSLRLAAFQVIASSDVSWHVGAMATVTGTVVSDPDFRHGRMTFSLRAEQIAQQGQTSPVTGEAFVTLLPQAQTTLDYGDRVALEGRLETPPDATNPGAFSWRQFLARRAVYSEMRVRRPQAVRNLGASRLNPFLTLAWRTRERILSAAQAALPPTSAAVLSGILLGRRAELPPDLMADFVHTGTVHILASAGLHVGIVACWLLFMFERLTLPRKVSAVLIIALLWLFAAMAGGRPSVTRAVVMATIYFAAVLFEREADLPTSVAGAAFVVLLLQPTALLEVGFQLSFLTVLILAVTMPVWDRFWRPRIERRVVGARPLWLARRAMEMVGLSLLAQVGSAPIVALAYNEVSLSGFPANVLVVPALFVLIPVGFGGALLWTVWHAPAVACFAVAKIALLYVTHLVRWFGESAWAYRAVPTPSPLAIGLYYALVYGVTDALSSRLPHAPPLSSASSARSAAARLSRAPAV